jgi:hypothetical protein
MAEDKEDLAALDFFNATIEFLTNDKGVHIETAVAATARMAGTFLFRSFGFGVPDAKPGQAVLSEEANEKGPQLVNILAGILDANGIKIDEVALESDPGPEHEPHLTFLETQPPLESLYEAIRKRHGLSYEEASWAAAAATAGLAIQGAGALDPAISFSIAVYGFIEGSKTIPAPIEPTGH